MMLAPLARNAEEAVGSMGNDTPLAVLSDRQPLLYSYFKQLFAQVTNPPIDSIREAVVMSVRTQRRLRAQPARRDAGARAPARDRQADPARRRARERCARSTRRSSRRARSTSRGRSPTVPTGSSGARARLRGGGRSARGGRQHPGALRPRRLGRARCRSRRCSLSAAVHHHLVREGTRLQAGLVVESGEPRSVHSVATLIGYGAAAVNPYVMLETLAELVDERLPTEDDGRGGAAAGGQGDREGAAEDDLEDGDLDDPVVLRRADLRGGRPRARARRAALHRHAVADRRHRPATCSREDALDRHARAYPGTRTTLLPVAGLYAWRRDGEHHQWNPETIALLQHAVRHGGVGDVRGVLRARSTRRPPAARRCAACCGSASPRTAAIPLDEVEPAAEIVKRFSTGAMSLGSISREAHETLAIAMNRIGGRSNTGEGGEDPVRLRRPERRLAPLGDQAGRLGPLRRQHRLPDERRRAADQDGAGREARRGRPAARPQGRPATSRASG